VWRRDPNKEPRSGCDFEAARCRFGTENTLVRKSIETLFWAVVRQIVVHYIKRISFSLAEVLRFGIAC
jgi:hypothetical protein